MPCSVVHTRVGGGEPGAAARATGVAKQPAVVEAACGAQLFVASGELVPEVAGQGRVEGGTPDLGRQPWGMPSPSTGT